MEVGIRDLRSNLSAVLEEVARGTTVTVTDRGTPTATISPIAVETPIQRGIREGWITVGAGSNDASRDRRPRSTFRLPEGVTLADILAEDRREDR